MRAVVAIAICCAAACPAPSLAPRSVPNVDGGPACSDDAACPADAFCCGDACRRAADVDHFCGCADPASFGSDCAADGATCVYAGVYSFCFCSCSVDQGGPTCSAPAHEGDPALCVCVDNENCTSVVDGVGVDSFDRFHVAADACTGSTCTCGDGAACGGTAQCTSTGCVTLETDAHNCGVLGHDCGGGDCTLGGCACATDDECTGNTDTCSGSCVCAGYHDDDGSPPTACPLGLTCAPGGCVVGDVTAPTGIELRFALGLPPNDGA